MMKRIVAIKYGESIYGEWHIFRGGRKDVMLPISFVIYLIQTEGRNILVDAGCDDKAGFEMSVFSKPSRILQSYGLQPSDITDLVITHAHHDHVQAANHYGNAEIYIQREEYEAAKKHLPENANVRLFDEETRAGDVIVRKIGGHSAGSSIVLAGRHVLCGDECYYLKCLTDRIPTGASYNEEKSLEFIKTYGTDDYIPHLFHDPGIMPGRIGYEILADAW